MVGKLKNAQTGKCIRCNEEKLRDNTCISCREKVCDECFIYSAEVCLSCHICFRKGIYNLI